MSHKTCSVLYAKYNSARRPDFRVTTEICEDADGLFVRKRAGSKAANAHLKTIHENGIALADYYKSIQVIPSELENQCVRFPYVSGKTLAEQVDPQHSSRDSFIAQVKEKLDAVLSVQDRFVVPFKSTEEFKALFGEVEPGEMPALNPANIDSEFSNFIENEAGIHCIDYEWVCHFPVPIGFIKYRTLLYLYVTHVHNQLGGASAAEMLEWFGISAQERDMYWKMEDHFQQCVHGEGREYIYTNRYMKRNMSIPFVEHEIWTKDQKLSAQDDAIREKDGHIGNLEKTTNDLQEHLRHREIHIQQLEHETRQALNQVIDLQKQVIVLQGQAYEGQVRSEGLENRIRDMQKEAAEREARIREEQVRCESLENRIRDMQMDTVRREAHIQELNRQIQQLRIDYETVTNAFFWRITKPARAMMDALKRLIKKNEFIYLSLHYAKDTLRHGKQYAKSWRMGYYEAKNSIQRANTWPSEEEQMRQRAERFPKDITFSILVPLYNTPEKYLRQMIKSVQNQTYEKWELCLADGSDNESSGVRSICREFARMDSRIHYRKLKKNLGISGNTNACIEMATGDYIALFDHDDMLHPSALYENMKAICEKEADFVYSDESIFHQEPSDAFYSHFKSDYAPDTLRSYNYICHLTTFKKTLLDEIGGGFRSQFDGSQDFDLFLRLTEKAQHIVHIPKILYYWRSHSGSTASDAGAGAKPYTIEAGKAALAEHLERVGLKGLVLDSRLPTTYRVQYEIEGTPLVSIVIPNMDHVQDLKKCIDSIVTKSTWNHWEIVIVENNSKEEETFAYYRSLENDPRIRVTTWKGGFNFSAICNTGARAAKGDYILLLNNDIEVITPDWLEQMLMYAQRSDVGAVGAMLYYPDDTIQHAGLIMGIGGSAGHSHKCARRGDYGYLMRLTLVQDLSGVTGACCMVPRHVWDEIDGLDEGFAVAFNDVDLCLRIRKAGYLIVWTPYAELYHYESKSRGYEDTPEKMERFNGERERLRARWADVIDAGDPYYNPNLRLDREDFSFR